MDYIIERRLFSYFALILSSVSSVTGQGNPAFSFSASDNSLLGTNVSFRCQYTYVDSETASNVNFQRKSNTDADFVSIVGQAFGSNTPTWTNSDLKSRSEISIRLSFPGPDGILTVRNLQCTDEMQYRCIFTVQRREEGFNDTYSSATDFKVNGKAQKPMLTYSPSMIVEKEPVTFTCTGNVGRPAGSLTMFLYNTISGRQEQQLQAQETTSLIEVLSSCTYERTIEATYNFTANQKTMVVICEVDQAYVDVENKQAVTGQLDIQYFPRSTQIEVLIDGRTVPSQDEVTVTEESKVQLKCTTDSNPTALYQWSYKHDSNNETVDRAPDNAGILLLNRITMDQSGEYFCNATNVINNMTYFDKQSISLIVTVKPSTLEPPVTVSTVDPTDPSQTTKDPGKLQQTPDDNTGMIVGLVVAGVVAIVLIIVVICFVKRRKSKGHEEFEEPPNKPRNNQDLRTVVTQPDLVTNGEKINNYNNKGYEKNEDQLYYADLAFDDKPRSRKPVQILSDLGGGGGGTDYAEISMPRV